MPLFTNRQLSKRISALALTYLNQGLLPEKMPVAEIDEHLVAVDDVGFIEGAGAVVDPDRRFAGAIPHQPFEDHAGGGAVAVEHHRRDVAAVPRAVPEDARVAAMCRGGVYCTVSASAACA